MLYADMSLWAEINNKSQNHNPIIEEYQNGLHNNEVEQYNRNAIQQNHKNQQ